MTSSPSISSRRVLRLSVALLAAGLVAVPASVASASPSSSASSGEESCWQDLDTGAVECFDSAIDPIDYIEEATGGPVVADDSSAAQRGVSAVAATYLLTTLFDQVNKGGVSFSYTTTNASICNGVSHGVNRLGEWDDRARSLQSFNGCRTTLFSEINTLGTVVGPFVASSDLGTFRDTASSLYIAV